MKKYKIKVLMPAAEIAPFVKVGGLADVTGSLPPALAKLNCDVRLIMPLYGTIDKNKYKLKKIHSNILIPSNNRNVSINVWQASINNFKTYFIENEKYFGKREVYTGNNSERYLFFSLAVLYVLPIIKFKPDIMHCHDFHTALIPLLMKTSDYSYFEGIKTLYTIHNLNFQGKSKPEILSIANLNPKSAACLKKDILDGDVNFMTQGIINSDLVNTVSPNYAKEISTSVYGAGLERVIKKNKDKITGIINGIDVNFFNPDKDKFIKRHYNLKTLDKKSLNKLALQEEIGLPKNKDIAVVGLISRLDWQKGLELITEKITELPCQFVFLGSGQKIYETALKKLEKKFPKNVKVNIGFSVELAQKIYAGSDIFLMPSRFEPCGLGQMIAMRYGAVPIVRDTGGLSDTVDIKTGFKFKNFSEDALKNSIKKGLDIYYNNKSQWKKLQINCLKKDFSWNKSAKEYLKLYKKLHIR